MINKSFHILRTNVALTTNVKVVVSSNYGMLLESIESERFLNQDRFKQFKLIKDSLLCESIPEFFKAVPEDIAYYVKDDKDQEVMFNSFDRQLDDIYFTGAGTVSDKRHEEEFEYFAPLHVNPNNLPTNFIIFRVDGTGRLDLDSTNFKAEIIDKLKVVSIYDLVTTNLGYFLDKNFNNKYFPKSPLDLDYREFEFSKWNGIDYLSGGFSSKSFFLNDTLKFELPFYEFDKFLTDGYKKNSVIYPNIINLSFLFNDTPANPDTLRRYSLNRYLGFYIDNIELVKTVTPFKTYQLVAGKDISNNIFYDSLLGESYDPIDGGWKSDKEYFVFYSGKFHYLTRTLVGTNLYEYKIISDQIFDTVLNPLHTTDLFNAINTDPYTIKTFYNTTRLRTELTLADNTSFIATLNAAELGKADVFLIKIDGKYHTLKYDSVNDVFYINTDYRIESNVDLIKYYIAGANSEYAKTINLGKHSKQSPPPTFEIYRLNFTEICDFDHDLKETKYAGYEYEDLDSSDGITKTTETKFYVNDHETDSVEPDLLTDNPASSEYIANDEYFALNKDNKLTELWRKNPTICKWGFAGSISHNDYPYRANNQISNLDEFNRASNPMHLEIRRSSNNLDYFYTHGYPAKNYVNHSLHLSEDFFNLLDYVNSTYDYFSKVFEGERTTSDGTNNFSHNDYKYAIFSGGSDKDPSSCVFRGSKFKMYDVSNILKDGDDIKEIAIVETDKYNDYKFSILFNSKRYDSSNNFVLFTGVEPVIGDSGVDVYVNHKYKNVLVNIYVNSDIALPEVHSQERDLLYTLSAITGATTLTTQTLILSNVFSVLNSLNTKRGFDNYVNYYVVEEDGTFDFTQSYNKLTYNGQNLPPFYLACELPDQFEVTLESLKSYAIDVPINLTLNNPLQYPDGKQPLARKFEYDKIEYHDSAVGSRGEFPETVSIYRFKGQHMPIFKRLELFKAYTNELSQDYGNYLFNDTLSDFGILKEQKMSKVNRFKNVLKLKDQKNVSSVYPMIDEFGYFLSDRFIFKSTWDDKYYLEVDNNTVAETPIPEDVKKSYLAAEFIYSPIYGTFNMKEQKSFFGSKGMDIEDQILINESSTTFFEDALTKEQSSTSGSEVLNSNYNFNQLKSIYHTIEQKKLQTDLERKELTKWIIKLNTRQLLKDYLFAQIKKARTFEDVLNINTAPNKVDLAIQSYIDLNLIDRYEIERVDFYVQYFSLEEDPALNQYNPLYSLSVKQNKIANAGGAMQTTNFSLTGNIKDNNVEIEYVQTKNSLDYKYDYYFDLVLKRA